MRILVDVTAETLQESTRRRKKRSYRAVYDCPVAIAVARTLDLPICVSWGFVCVEHATPCYLSIPRQAQKWMEHWDLRAQVAPFQFYLKVPKQLKERLPAAVAALCIP